MHYYFTECLISSIKELASYQRLLLLLMLVKALLKMLCLLKLKDLYAVLMRKGKITTIIRAHDCVSS